MYCFSCISCNCVTWVLFAVEYHCKHKINVKFSGFPLLSYILLAVIIQTSWHSLKQCKLPCLKFCTVLIYCSLVHDCMYHGIWDVNVQLIIQDTIIWFQISVYTYWVLSTALIYISHECMHRPWKCVHTTHVNTQYSPNAALPLGAS